LADFDFVLTHSVLGDKAYAKYYTDHREDRYLVLDNSTNEKLEPCTLEEIREAAETVKPDLIVAPDYLGNHFATERALEKCLEIWPKNRILPVLQGHDYATAMECTDFIDKLGFDRIAVPYDIACGREASLESMAASRYRVIRALHSSQYSFDVHLLGLTTLEEVGKYRDWMEVESIDTGSPVLHGLRGKMYGRSPLLPKSDPTMNLMESAVIGEYPEIDYGAVYHNIAYLRKILNY
jgi:hypothetical protein